MGDLTEHFSRHEMRCPCGRCGGGDTVDYELLVHLQYVRQHFGLPVNLNSVYRCLEYNRSPRIGSNDASQHPLGRAADHWIEGVTPARLYAYYDSRWPDKYGLGLYNTFVHFDTRVGPAARWRG